MVAISNATRTTKGGVSDADKDAQIFFWTMMGGLLLPLFLILTVFGYMAVNDHLKKQAVLTNLQGYAKSNDGLVEVVRALGETDVYKYGNYKQHEARSYDVVVEVRGLKDGRTMILREHADRVFFDHLPQVGDIFRIMINNDRSINLMRADE